MSEQAGNSSKRRRVEERNSSLVGSASGSSTAGASTSTAGNAPPSAQQLKVVATITPELLQTLLLDENQVHHPFLIIDVREPHCFKEQKINSAHCINAPVQNSSGDSSSSDVVTFDSRREVIRILENDCPELLLHLRPPGHYSHVVISDDKSTAANCSESVRLIYDALKKWHEKTSIWILVLQGGFARFSGEFPNLAVTSNDTGSPNIQADETPTLAEVLQHVDDCEYQEMATVGNFVLSLRHLDKKIDVLRKLITLKAKVVALETLEVMLLGEVDDEKDKLRQILETSFPEGSKCRICYGVFRGEILQCRNGHSLCANCCERLSSCPECGVAYQEKVRNLALEDLVESNALKTECVCGLMFGRQEVESHVHACVKKSKPDMELKGIKSDLCAAKVEFTRILGKRKKISEKIVASEDLWYSELTEARKVTPSVFKKLLDYRFAKMSSINSLEQTLFSMCFSNP